MPASPPAPLAPNHPPENGSFLPASIPTFLECPSNSLYIHLDYATTSTLLCFHAAYTPPHPPRHLTPWSPPTTSATPLPDVAPLTTALRSNGSFGGLLSEDLPTFRLPPPFPLFFPSVRDWVYYLLPLACAFITIGCFFHLCKCYFPFFHSRQGFISFTFTTYCCFSLGRPPVCLQALVCGW